MPPWKCYLLTAEVHRGGHWCRTEMTVIRLFSVTSLSICSGFILPTVKIPFSPQGLWVLCYACFILGPESHLVVLLGLYLRAAPGKLSMLSFALSAKSPGVRGLVKARCWEA